MGKKVYIVTKGYYDDYSICGVYSTQELAEKMRKVFDDSRKSKWDEARIEEYEMDKLPPDFVEGKKRYIVRLKRSGAVDEVYQATPWTEGGLVEEVVPWHNNQGWSFVVWANTRRQAIKKAKEKLLQLLANEQANC